MGFRIAGRLLWAIVICATFPRPTLSLAEDGALRADADVVDAGFEFPAQTALTAAAVVAALFAGAVGNALTPVGLDIADRLRWAIAVRAAFPIAALAVAVDGAGWTAQFLTIAVPKAAGVVAALRYPRGATIGSAFDFAGWADTRRAIPGLFSRAGNRLRCRRGPTCCLDVIDRACSYRASDSKQGLQHLSPTTGSRQATRERIETSIVHELPLFVLRFPIVADWLLPCNIFSKVAGKNSTRPASLTR
jgi:hypothetical protein